MGAYRWLDGGIYGKMGDVLQVNKCRFVRELGIREIRYTNYRVAVGLLVGQGCERSELPCLADGITKQGRRSWSFYIYHTCCLLDRRICGQMLLTNDIVFGHWFTSNR